MKYVSGFVTTKIGDVKNTSSGFYPINDSCFFYTRLLGNETKDLMMGYLNNEKIQVTLRNYAKNETRELVSLIKELNVIEL
jgi:hypothetical protein